MRRYEISRRDILKSGSATALLGSGAVQTTAATTGESTFVVEQDGTEHTVSPLTYGDRTAEEFYSYGYPDGSSANTPTNLEKSDTSRLFFYAGPNGLSLVVIHDEPRDGDGGATTFEFDTLPTGGGWAVPDDRGERFTRTRADWGWASCCTDGGVYRGEFSDLITITPSFQGGIDSWELLSGDASTPEVTELDLSAPITISPGSGDGGESLQQLADQKLGLADRIDDNSFGYVDDRSQVSPTLSRLIDGASAGELSEETAADAIKRLQFGERVTDTVLAGAGPGTSPLSDEDRNLSRLTAQSAVNPVLDILFAGLSLVKAAKRIPFVKGAARRAAKYLADLAADIAGYFSRSLERLIRRQGEDAGYAILEEAESRTADEGKKIAEDEFAETRAAQGTILIEDSSEVIFRDYLFDAEHDFQGTPTEPLDQSLSAFIDEVDPDPDPGIDGSTADARTASENSIDAVNNIYETIEDSIGALDSILLAVGALEAVLGVVAFIAGVTGVFSAVGVVAGAAAALLGLGLGTSLQMMKWTEGVNGILAARYRHQETLPAVRHPEGGV